VWDKPPDDPAPNLGRAGGRGQVVSGAAQPTAQPTGQPTAVLGSLSTGSVYHGPPLADMQGRMAPNTFAVSTAAPTVAPTAAPPAAPPAQVSALASSAGADAQRGATAAAAPPPPVSDTADYGGINWDPAPADDPTDTGRGGGPAAGRNDVQPPGAVYVAVGNRPPSTGPATAAAAAVAGGTPPVAAAAPTPAAAAPTPATATDGAAATAAPVGGPAVGALTLITGTQRNVPPGDAARLAVPTPQPLRGLKSDEQLMPTAKTFRAPRAEGVETAAAADGKPFVPPKLRRQPLRKAFSAPLHRLR